MPKLLQNDIIRIHNKREEEVHMSKVVISVISLLSLTLSSFINPSPPDVPVTDLHTVDVITAVQETAPIVYHQTETQYKVHLDDKHVPDEVYEYSRLEKIIFTPEDEAYAEAPKSAFDSDIPKDYFKEFYNLSTNEIEVLFRQFDQELLNIEFGKLMNAYRVEQGVHEIEYVPDYLPGTIELAKELADYGFIAADGQEPHTRPAPNLGAPTRTLFKGHLYDEWSGENLLYGFSRANPYRLVSEKWIADEFFDLWLNSEGHRLNMISPNHTGFAVAYYPVMNGNSKSGFEKNGRYYVTDEKVSNENGIGYIGLKTFTNQ